MKKLKIITIVGTRPEIIRLSEIIKKLDRYLNHKLIHTGQNYDYELNEIFFKDLEIREPNYFLNASGTNLLASNFLPLMAKKISFFFIVLELIETFLIFRLL